VLCGGEQSVAATISLMRSTSPASSAMRSNASRRRAAASVRPRRPPLSGSARSGAQTATRAQWRPPSKVITSVVAPLVEAMIATPCSGLVKPMNVGSPG